MDTATRQPTQTPPKASKPACRCIYCDGAIRTGQGLALNRFPGDVEWAHKGCLRREEAQ